MKGFQTQALDLEWSSKVFELSDFLYVLHGRVGDMLYFSTIVVPDPKSLFTDDCILIFFLICRNGTPSLVTTTGGPTLSPTSLMIAWVRYLPVTMSVCCVD